MAKSPNRFIPALATIAVLGGAGAACWFGAGAAASFIENRSYQDVSVALRTAGQDWAQVSTDGLRVYLTGTAPTEVERFRAMSAATSAVDSSRVIDRMTVAAAEALDPPDFEVELLRNDDGIQMIGLVPAATDRQNLVRMLRAETAAPQITDLLESADYAVPPGWQPALDFGLQAAQMSARAKISISAGKVTVTALADSAAEKARMEAALLRMKPRAITLTTEISAPRPVIAPFTLRFLIDDDGARFDACAADTAEARDQIIAAATRAGVAAGADCTIGLGAPTPEWQAAAVAAIGAVAGMGHGTVTISDADVALIAPADVESDRFDEMVGRLERALPAVFSLQSRHEQPLAADNGPAEFDATVANDGTVALRGRITDDRMRDAVDSFAGARFKGVDSSLRTDPDTPGGWTVRVIAGLEAMAPLKNGAVTVTPDLIRLSGTSGDPDASSRAAASLAVRLGAGAHYELAIRYDRRLDDSLGLPDGDECVARLNTIMAESAIGFEPNKSAIAGDPEDTLENLVAAMTDCSEFQIEIGGHTDSQGSEGFNADLSRARAQAIMAALADEGGNIANMSARGYGESQPIATNQTEEGREANRRIEFRLLSDLPVRDTPLPAPQMLSGVTGAMPETTAPATTPEGAPEGQGTQPVITIPAPPIADQLPAFVAPPAGLIPPRPPAPVVRPVMSVTVPSVVGAREQARNAFPPEDENARVPVLTPDDNTPRPLARPGGEAEDNDTAGQ